MLSPIRLPRSSAQLPALPDRSPKARLEPYFSRAQAALARLRLSRLLTRTSVVEEVQLLLPK